MTPRISIALGLLALALLVLAPPARARCASGATATWPAKVAEVGPRPLLVLDLYGTHQARAAKPRALRLTASGAPLPYTVEWRTEGQRFTQIALRPDAAQPKGTELRLSLPVGAARKVIARWRVGAAQATPAWAAAPTLRAPLRHIRMGCGPAIQAQVATKMGGEPGDPTAFVVAVAGKTVLLRPAHDGTVSIGHGMCGGPLKLDPSAIYQAQLRPIGPGGQPGEARSIALR